ncbi:MAG TPA: hypothetical protein VEY89_02585, partial [Candidatus Dormibacteraeota bacterium]|nr:hypothetical protein [Candidatus Dormibacteraeota bacterium]
IVAAVMRSLAKDPEVRFQSADEFASALPDVAPAPTTASPQRASTGTVVIERPPTASAKLALEPKGHAPRVGPTGTIALKDAPPKALSADSSDSMTIDFSMGTIWDQLHPPRPAPPAAPAPSPAADTARSLPPAVQLTEASRPGQLLRAGAPAVVALLLATLAVGALLRHEGRLDPPLAQEPAPAATESPPPSLPATTAENEPATAAPSEAAASPAVPTPVSATPVAATPLAATPATVTPATATPAEATRAPARATTLAARHALSGTWSGAYVNAAGKQLLRVVSLSISRVYADGGVEGSLQYEAASGDGECQLHPRRSSWSAPTHRLQLSPESCSPHYPRELGVPLDFAGVNPRANILRDGRIEAPSGEVIKVRLKRVSGV